MRATDQAPPALTVDPHPPPPWMTGRLVIALERLSQAAYVWDDDDPTILWDDPDPDRLVWDAPFIGEGFTDVWCDMVSLSVAHGEPDQWDNFRASAALLELRDPGDGRYRTRTVDGRLVYYATGRRLAVWWLDPAGVPWWLFSGQIATWRERLDGTVGIEAYSGWMLGRPQARAWTAGTAGDFPSERVGKIITAIAPGIPVRADLGDVTLSVPEASDVIPLDALRQVTWSDGGIVFTDADDTLITRDRRWRDGRADQTGDLPILTDNVCDAGIDGVVIADPETADDFLRQAGRVVLENDADPALIATATAPPATIPPDIVFTHPGRDLWRTQAEGNALAAFIIAERSTGRVALGTGDVYLHDRRFDYWSTMIDRRIGDRVRFQHDDPFGFFDVTAILTTLRHTITPESWVVNVGTSPAVDYTAVELWDRTLLTWDDPNPLAVWR